MSPTGRLRVAQIGCIVLVVACGLTAHLTGQKRTGRGGAELIVCLAAIWGAVAGFTIQRKLLSGNTTIQRKGTKSNPLTRWRAGNLIRLWSAASVGIWALVLVELGGSQVLAALLFAVSLLLLILWKPGSDPPKPAEK
jgi:hypothetical protein